MLKSLKPWGTQIVVLWTWKKSSRVKAGRGQQEGNAFPTQQPEISEGPYFQNNLDFNPHPLPVNDR